MKKHYLLLVSFLCLFLFQTANAQYCGNSGPSACTPGGPYPLLGFYPPYDSLPCAVIGQLYNEKIDMQVPATTVSSGITANIDSIRVVSVSNLPCGVCWKTDVASNTFRGNSTHCIQVNGTTYDAVGQYNMVIIIDLFVKALGIPITRLNQNAADYGIKYFAHVRAPGGPCPVIDTLAAGNTATIAGAITPVTINGNSVLCNGASTTLQVAGTYQTYVWSTGALTPSITTSTGGTYTVTVYDKCTSATASKTVTATTLNANVTASGATNICLGDSITLDAGAGYTGYSWSNGATTQTIKVAQAGGYTATVTQSGCSDTSNTVTVSVTDPTVNITANGPTTFCQGGSVVLDAGSGFASYAWSGSETTQTVTVSTGGTYTVTVTKNNCTATDDIDISVSSNNLSPVITATDTTLCAGGVATIDAGVGYTTYIWSTGDTIAQFDVSPATTATYTVTVTQGTCSGSATLDITVGNFPIAVTVTPAGPVSVCEGDIVVLDAGNLQGVYNWSTGDTGTTIQTDTAGTFTVTVTDNACSGTNSVTVTTKPVPNPVITPADTVSICEGKSTVLSATAGFDTYAWSGGGSNAILGVSAAGTYDVTVTLNGCTGISSASTTVNVNPVTVAQVDTIIYGSEDLLIANSTGLTGFQWLRGINDSTTLISFGPGSDTLTILCTAAGYYAVIGTNSFGCTDTSSFVYVGPCSGIEDVVYVNNFVVKPNPARDVLNVSYQLENNSNIEISVIDITGRKIISAVNEYENSGSYQHSINLAGLSQGVYVVNFSSAKGTFNSKFIKE